MYSPFLKFFLIYLLIGSISLSVSFPRTVHGCSISSAFLNAWPVFIVELICWLDIISWIQPSFHTCSSFYFFYFRKMFLHISLNRLHLNFLRRDIYCLWWISPVFLSNKLFTYCFKFFSFAAEPTNCDYLEPFFYAIL